MKNKVIDGLFGLCVGDALGVPVESCTRKTLEKNPVIGMNLRKETGEMIMSSHNQKPGTWSDDSSLTFCLVEILCNEFNLRKIGDKFCSWVDLKHWTPRGVVFDIGGTTKNAINTLRRREKEPIDCGEKETKSNGNGSLMRILPMAYYVKDMPTEKQYELTHQVSCLTHAHLISQISCGIYIQIAINLL